MPENQVISILMTAIASGLVSAALSSAATILALKTDIKWIERQLIDQQSRIQRLERNRA